MKMQEKDDAVFAMLCRCAEAGEECPSNLAFAEITQSESVSNGPRILHRLERRGLIRVRRNNHARVITIVATGKQTAGEIIGCHWTQERKHRRPEPRVRRTRLQIEDEAPLPTVNREPCPRCGVRGDIGCCHSGAPLTGMVMVGVGK